MAELKKIQIGARVSGELNEKFKAEMAEKGLTQTELLEKCLVNYFNAPTPEPQIVEKVVEVPAPRSQWDINLLECGERVVAAFMEVAHKKQVGKEKILSAFVEFIERNSKAIEPKYVEVAKQVLNENKQ